MKNCTPLWREAHFEVKMYKALQLGSTFGSCDAEKAHAVVARSTFPSQNAQNTPCSDHFWKLRCRKSARCCGAKQISKPKCTKHTMFGPLLKIEMWKSARRCCAKHVAKSKCKKHQGFGHFWRFRCRFAWQAQGIVHLVKSEENVRFWSISKNHGRRGISAEDLQRCIFRGRRSTGADFLRRVAFWSIRSSGLLK